MLQVFGKALFSLGFVTLLGAVLAGCSDNATSAKELSSQPSVQPMVITMSVPSDKSDPKIVLENGQTLNLEEFKKALASAKDTNQLIQLKMADSSSAISDSSSPVRGVSVGRYWADVRWEWGYVPGCIHTNAWHLNLHLRDIWANRELVNIHMASWWDNGPQFGIYNSGANKFCAQSRGTFTGIRESLTDFFRLSVNIPQPSAQVLGYSVAMLCVLALPFLVFA